MSKSKLRVGLVLYPGCIPSGLMAISDLLEAANQLSGRHFFQLHWLGDRKAVTEGIESNPNSSVPDLQIKAHYQINEVEVDAIIIPGMWMRKLDDLEAVLGNSAELIQAIKALPKSVQIHSYCTSVSFLAMTGRLDKHVATSTWWLTQFYTQKFTKVDWRFDKAFVAGDNYSCASGVNGYLPIAMNLVEKHLGEKVLRDVTRTMLLPRPEGVQQPFQKVDPLTLNDNLMRRIHRWVEEHHADELGTEKLAKAMHMSERTLARRIKMAVNESTMGFMRLIKLNQASEKLILSDMSIGQISSYVGYQDDRTFRRSFKKVTGYTPGEYRETFKRPQFQV